MLSFTSFVILVSLFAAFIILLLQKVGFIEEMQLHGTKVISKLFSCQFCLSFWFAVFLSVGAVGIFSIEFTFLFAPFFSAPLTRYIL